MNILYLINYAGKGGTERYVQLLASHFIKENNVHFMYNKEGPLCEKMRGMGIVPVHISMKHPLDMTAAKQIAEYCKKHSIHIVHTQFLRENYVALLSKYFMNGLKVIYTAHLHEENNHIWKYANSKMGANNDAIIAVCTWGKECLIRNKMPEDKITVIFNGANTRIKPEFERTADFYDKTPFSFMTVTRFTPEKGTRFLLESSLCLRTMTKKPFRVVFIGDGPLLEADKNYVRQRGLTNYVLFTGYRKDARDILQEAHVFVNSSRTEGLSFAILEAMALGLPLIATDQGGNRDIINDKRRCGILVPYDQPDVMAAAMLQMMDYPNLEQGLNSRKAIEEVFNIERTIKETYDIYKSIVEGESDDY